jgi:hypothetical protein
MGALICDSCIHKVVCEVSCEGLCKGECALYAKVEKFTSTNTAMGQLLWEVQEMCRNGISINQVQFDIYNKIEKSGLAQQPHS